MAHGYLGDGYGTHGEIDPDRSDNRDREHARNRDWSERDWRGRDDEWRNPSQNRSRSLMFGGRERSGWSDEGDRWSDEDRWSGRGGWTGAETYRGAERGSNRNSDRGFSPGSAHSNAGERSYSANPDDHYRSWRDRQMNALDQDYADYCREREQQFHRDFDDWRRNRQSNTGGTSGEIAVAADEERTHERAMNEEGNAPSPLGAATLGTNNSENAATGRGRR